MALKLWSSPDALRSACGYGPRGADTERYRHGYVVGRYAAQPDGYARERTRRPRRRGCKSLRRFGRRRSRPAVRCPLPTRWPRGRWIWPGRSGNGGPNMPGRKGVPNEVGQVVRGYDFLRSQRGYMPASGAHRRRVAPPVTQTLAGQHRRGGGWCYCAPRPYPAVMALSTAAVSQSVGAASEAWKVGLGGANP